jgi:hypothetical protein
MLGKLTTAICNALAFRIWCGHFFRVMLCFDIFQHLFFTVKIMYSAFCSGITSHNARWHIILVCSGSTATWYHFHFPSVPFQTTPNILPIQITWKTSFTGVVGTGARVVATARTAATVATARTARIVTAAAAAAAAVAVADARANISTMFH